MADEQPDYASDEDTIIASQRSSHPSVNAINPDEEIMPRASWLDFRENNHHLDLDSDFTHRIFLEIIRGHPICTALTRVERVPAIYLQQFWHTLRFNPTARPPRFNANIDHFEVRITLQGLRRALELPRRDNFEDPAIDEELFGDIRSLGYQDPNVPVLTGSSQFRRKHLPPVWYTLCSILNRCMTSKHTGLDKTNLAILKMFHAFAFNRNIDYAVLIWNEMKELVEDQARPSKRRTFVPFQRFFQILIHQAMEDRPEIPRREEAERGPTNWMHRLVPPAHEPFVQTAVIRQEVLNYADQNHWVVVQYREQNALVVQQNPAGPAQDANPLGGEGPIVEGVQEQGVPEQREVRNIRQRVGGRSRDTGHASSSRPRTEPFRPIIDFGDYEYDSDSDTNLTPRQARKRPRVETPGAGSSRQPDPMDTSTDAAGASNINEGVDADVENVFSGEERGRKERSEHVTESEKVLTTDSPQADPSRVPTSSANVRLSPLSIESDMVRPTMQCTPPPSHSSVSQQAGVSFSTGEQAHTLSAAQSVLAGIEAGRLLPRPPPFFQSTSSLAPFGTPSFLRTPMMEHHHVGSFRAPTGTPRVPSPFVGASRGSGGSPVIANTMPALNTGRTVSSTATSTSNLRGLGVSSQEEAGIERALSLVGPPPNRFVPFSLLKLFVASLNNSFTAHETAMTAKFDKLSEEVTKAIKGKDVAESSTSEPQPTRAEPVQQDPSSIPLHLVPEDQLKSELLARLLAKSDPRTGEDTDLLSLLRQQNPPQPPPSQPQASTSTDTPLIPQFEQLNTSISNMTDSIFAGFQSLAKRVEVVEQACGVQAEASLKRRHDDPDDPDHHEGEKRTGDIGTSAAATTGSVVETGTDKSTGTSTEGNTGTGASDTEMVQAVDVNVLADVIAGVEKPSASDNRTTDWFSDDMPIDRVHIDSDEEPERTTVQIKQEIENAFEFSEPVLAATDSDTTGTSASLHPTPVILPPAPAILILQADERLKDSTLEAELGHFQEIVDSEPRFLATGLRVRILTPFQESRRRDMFVKEIKKISWEKVYGIEDLPERIRIEYLYFMRYESLNANTVMSDKPIRKVLKIESRKLSKVWFPEFTVQRSDGSEQVFNEADFQRLKLNDICILYEILSRDPQKKGEWSDAYQSLKRFMKNILKFSYLKDFQMALEARQVNVNIRPPRRYPPDLQGIPAYTVLEDPDIGIVYPDSDSKHKFLRISDINKFSDGTFKMIQIHLECSLRLDAKGEQKLTDREKELIKEIMDAFKYRMDYRNALRRFEMIFGLRKTQVVPLV